MSEGHIWFSRNSSAFPKLLRTVCERANETGVVNNEESLPRHSGIEPLRGPHLR